MKKQHNTNIFITLSFLILMAAGCASPADSENKMNEDNTSNTNSTKPEEEWISLFDGQTTKGWRPFQNKSVDSWSAEDGTLHCKAVGTGSEKRGNLITVDQFENFELMVDWKIAPKGNSGIIYMVSETTAEPHLSGPEYQLIDDEGYPAKLENWQKSGANYAMNPPLRLAAKPVGEWNTARILVNKGHVEHWLNGEKVVEYELWSDKWKADKNAGKWKDAPEYGAKKHGHISLQDHG